MRLKKVPYVLLLLVLPLLGARSHDFYVSITQLKWKENRWQGTVKLFKDDVQTCFRERYGEQVVFDSPQHRERVDSLLNLWLLEEVRLTAGNRLIPFRYAGMEAEPELLWVYFETDQTETTQSLTVRNSLLMTEFPEQLNLVHLEAGSARASLYLRSTDFIQTADL